MLKQLLCGYLHYLCLILKQVLWNDIFEFDRYTQILKGNGNGANKSLKTFPPFNNINVHHWADLQRPLSVKHGQKSMFQTLEPRNSMIFLFCCRAFLLCGSLWTFYNKNVGICAHWHQ